MFDELFAQETEVKIVPVYLPDSKKTLYIGSLSAEDYAAWTAMNDGEAEAKKNAAALLISNSLVQGPDDPDGKMTAEQRTSAEKRIGTREMVAKWRGIRIATSERILKAIMKLNGINQPEVEKAKNS